MRILGISAFYHDSAAALVDDGTIVAAAQEERFTRKKHDAGFPRHAVGYCLAEAGVGLDERRPRRPSTTSRSSSSSGCSRPISPSRRKGFTSFRMAMPLWLKEKLFQKKLLRRRAASRAGATVDWKRRCCSPSTI